MRRSMFGASALMCGLLIFISSMSGCSEETPRPTPPPPLPHAGCTNIGTCLINGPTSDDNLCTIDECDECGQTVYRPAINLPCGEGTDCRLTPMCQNGFCVQSLRPDGFECFFDDICAAPGTCMAGTCIMSPLPLCKADELCDFGKCIKQCSTTTWSVPIPASLTSYSMDTGDFNGDGLPDLAIADVDYDLVYLLLNNGDSSFSIKSYDAGPIARSLAAADLNGDGMADLAITNEQQSNGVNVLFSTGNGGLSPSGLYPLNAELLTIGADDMNGDGKTDLVVGDIQDGTHVFLNQGNGTFSPDISYDGGSVIAFADLNGDTHVDLAVASLKTANINTLINKGDATFNTKVTQATGIASLSVVSADFDGDGRVDLATTDYNFGGLFLLRNNGNGSFDTTELPTGPSPLAVAAADLNSDGHVDLAVMNYYGSSLDIHLNEGNGTFAKPLIVQAGFGPTLIVAADMNGDGKPDLAVFHEPDTVTIYLNDCLVGQ